MRRGAVLSVIVLVIAPPYDLPVLVVGVPHLRAVKAAAVTVISEEAGCAMEIEDHQSLVMDKNFGFILTDWEDNILFEGKVINPVADNN
jgi:serine protease inhibitor